MRVLFVAAPERRQDGWGVYARELSAALEQRGNTIVRTPFLAPPASYLANPWRSYRAARNIARLAYRENIDAIHIVAEPYATLVPFLPRALAHITTITVHGTYAWYPQLIRNPLKRACATLMMRGAYAAAGNIVCVSKYTKEYLMAHSGDIGCPRSDVGHPMSKIHVIPNGVNLDGVTITHPHHAIPQFLTVGGVKLRKGALEAVDAVAAYMKKYGACRLRIIGSLTDEPWYVERVRARIEEFELSNCIELMGSVAAPELARAYVTADAFIMLNVSDGKEFEGFGLVFLEAAARGCPALGALGTAAEEAIKEGVSGYCVDAHDNAAAAMTLHRIVTTGASLRASSRTWAEAHSWENIAARYAETYENLRPL